MICVVRNEKKKRKNWTADESEGEPYNSVTSAVCFLPFIL